MNQPIDDNAFSNLGPWGWVKLVFRTRAMTIKQCDKLTHAMFMKSMQAGMRAETAEKMNARLAKLVITQVEALESVRIAGMTNGWSNAGHRENETFEQVCGAIEASREAV